MIAFIGNMEGDKMGISIIKKIIIFITLILIISNIPIHIYATTDSDKTVTFDSIISAGDSFLEAGDDKTDTFEGNDLQGLSNFVSGVLLTIAIGVTLISGVVMGINFMVQSVEDKAKIKESMIPWVIGIIISFGAFGIWQITINIFTTNL